MNDEEYYEEEYEEDPLESDCPYGFEFCEDPQTRAMNLCTTECKLYFDTVELEEKELRERSKKR